MTVTLLQDPLNGLLNQKEVRGRKILVLNRGSPEINHLATALSQQDKLYRYVCPYINKARTWERILSMLPGFGSIYKQTLGRRVALEGLDLSRVQEVAVLEDFTMAILIRLSRKANFLKKWSLRLNYGIEEHLGKAGANYAKDSRGVVGSVAVALPAFRAASGRRILNYPTAHHRFIQDFVREEAQREPAFAATLPAWGKMPQIYQEQLDEECELADHILVGSSFAKDSFIQSGIREEKLIVVPYGTDVSLFYPPPENDKERNTFNIIFAGQIGQRKGIAYLLRAYEKFQGPGTTLTLVGDFYGSSEPFKHHRHLFRHIPNIPRWQLAKLYQEADVFIFPTLIEGLGLVVIEAMASGLPVIVTPNGPGDLVRDGVDGFVVPPRDVDILVDRLEYLRAHPEARKRMGSNARQRASMFSWKNYTDAAIVAIESGSQVHPGLE